jgi:hypothetical protein
MALLSRMMRTVAVTGRTEDIHTWFADRQAGRWAERTMRAGLPSPASSARGTPAAAVSPSPADPAETMRGLTRLHERGILTDAEFERLRARKGL